MPLLVLSVTHAARTERVDAMHLMRKRIQHHSNEETHRLI